MRTDLAKTLDVIEEQNIDFITFKANTFQEEYKLPSDDKDYVTFHIGKENNIICDKLNTFNYKTTDKPIYKDWYMTINYHS